MSIYTDKGYNSRKDYLRQLADEYGVPLGTVCAVAQVLGEDEDFDGLVVAMQDYEGFENCDE